MTARDECAEIAELLWDHAAGRLGAGESRRVADHLARCEACATLAQDFQAAADLVLACKREPIPPSNATWESLRATLQAEKQPVRAPWIRRLFPSPALSAAALASGAFAALAVSAWTAWTGAPSPSLDWDPRIAATGRPTQDFQVPAAEPPALASAAPAPRTRGAQPAALAPAPQPAVAPAGTGAEARHAPSRNAGRGTHPLPFRRSGRKLLPLQSPPPSPELAPPSVDGEPASPKLTGFSIGPAVVGPNGASQKEYVMGAIPIAPSGATAGAAGNDQPDAW